MGIITALVLLATATQIADAHFSIQYPPWRADTLATGSNYSQWLYPCMCAIQTLLPRRI